MNNILEISILNCNTAFFCFRLNKHDMLQKDIKLKRRYTHSSVTNNAELKYLQSEIDVLKQAIYTHGTEKPLDNNIT